jgi:uncharacterized membrane protein (UPF0127 family)
MGSAQRLFRQTLLMRLEREHGGGVVCERCEVADNALRRMKGLLGRSSLGVGEGLLIRPASSIHMFFMRFPIDAVFLDRTLQVVGIAESLRPWRVAGRRGARAVLELPAGEAARRGLRPGERLVLTEEEGDQGAEREEGTKRKRRLSRG